MSGTFDKALDTLEQVAEDMAGVALKAIGQRDDLLRERNELSEQLEVSLAQVVDWMMSCGELSIEQAVLSQRVRELEAELEHVRGIVFDVDLRGAVQALLKSEMSAGELRRALGELVR